ncbi:hypothetical protein BGW39_009714 [Mortierella sp. 14UC]|nr:hypothetical protein BGW39_009714 [Mortierella sp. 14UC]
MLPPEILDQIAPLLDFQSRLSCLYVNHFWRSVFTPWLWHTISSDDHTPWRRLFKSANYHSHHHGNNNNHSGNNEDNDDREPEELRAFRMEQLRKHGQFIRHASLYDPWSVGLLLQAKSVTQLRSLVIYRHRHSPHTGLSAQALTELLLVDRDVPEHLFQKKVHDSNSVALARACWQLIAKNTNFESARFMSSSIQSLSPFYRTVLSKTSRSDSSATSESERSESERSESDGEDGDAGGNATTGGCGDNTNDHKDVSLTPTDYLINVVSTLPRLSHLRPMHSSFEWLLPALVSGLLPTIRSYVYSNGDTSALDNLVSSPSSLCTILESLQILPPIRVRHLRSIMSAFPALKSLELWRCETDAKDPPLLPHNPVTPAPPGGKITTSKMELIIHTEMEKIKVSEICDLLRARVQFPNLKTFGGLGEILDLRQLLLTLRSFPTLEHLETVSFKGQDSRRDSRLSIEKEPDWDLGKDAFLVRLELKTITLDTLVHLSTAGNYRHLQHVRFNLTRPYYKETNRLFVNCPGLKSIQGLGIAVLAKAMIHEPLWTCRGLQKFQCEIHGVQRLN